MTINGLLQLLLFCFAVILVTKPLGIYMTKVFNGEQTFLSKLLNPIERLIYLVCRVNDQEEQHWTTYTAAMLIFSVAGSL